MPCSTGHSRAPNDDGGGGDKLARREFPEESIMEEASLNCGSREGRVPCGVQPSQALFDVIKAGNRELGEKDGLSGRDSYLD